MLWFDRFRTKKAGFDNVEAYRQRTKQLTIMEYKIFMLLREGFSVKECSQRLNMKRREVKIYLKSIFKKLKVRSLVQLIIEYREER